MKIKFLGTGTSQGIPVIACECAVCRSLDSRDKRLRTALSIEKEGFHIVIDAGPDFRQQMLTHQVKHLDAILITHEHRDHIAGLDDVRSFNFKQQIDMPIYAQQRVIDRLKIEYAYAFEAIKYPGVPSYEVFPVDKDELLHIGPFDVQPIEVIHYKLPILGYRFDNFTYITDAKTIAPSEVAKIEGSEYLVLNALQHQPHISHFTVNEAIAFVNSLKQKPKTTFLTHMSHTLGMHSEEQQKLPEGFKFAFDGLELEI